MADLWLSTVGYTMSEMGLRMPHVSLPGRVIYGLPLWAQSLIQIQYLYSPYFIEYLGPDSI